MPNRDQTGPLGNGPATGWGRGPCGSGQRRGFGNRFRRFFSPANDKQSLQQEQKFLEDELDAVKQELAKLKDQQ